MARIIVSDGVAVEAPSIAAGVREKLQNHPPVPVGELRTREGVGVAYLADEMRW